MQYEKYTKARDHMLNAIHVLMDDEEGFAALKSIVGELEKRTDGTKEETFRATLGTLTVVLHAGLMDDRWPCADGSLVQRT